MRMGSPIPPTRMTRRTAYALLVFWLIGFGASIGSSYVHYRLLNDPGYASFCDFSETWNCETVYGSQYGAFRGVPVAAAGVIWFVGAGLLVAAGWPRETAAPSAAPAKAKGKATRPETRRDHLAESAPAYLFVWCVVGLSFVLYLAYASFFVLRTFCLLCLLTYIGVIGLFLLSGSASNLAMRSLPARLGRDVRLVVARPVTLIVLLLFVVGAITTLAYFPKQPGALVSSAEGAVSAAPSRVLTDGQQAQFEAWYKACRAGDPSTGCGLPAVPVPVPAEGAKVVVVKFNDYQCPPCKQTYLEYKPVIDKYRTASKGAVKYVVKDYPLDPECNAHAPAGQHLAACEAAVAVRLAEERGRGDEMQAWLFDNQSSLSPTLVRQGARDVGRVSNFDAHYPQALEQVKADTTLGGQLGVRGTPTFFINGVRIPGLRAEFFDAAIAYELKQAGVQ
jgi:uncharacterized membrane protein/protein-disulfide isomerase